MNSLLTIYLDVCLRIAWSSTYTYILLLFVAAAFIAYISRPRARGEVVKKICVGELMAEVPFVETTGMTGRPYIHVRCAEEGKVEFFRVGFEGLTLSGSDSLALSFNGKDVTIEERITPGFGNDEPTKCARYLVDMTGYSWRHIQWIDSDSGLWCAFQLHVREGIEFDVALRQ